MKAQYAGSTAELWSEFALIIDKLSYKELLWLILFVSAYHDAKPVALEVMCPEGSTMWEEAVYMTNSNRRGKPNENRKRKLKDPYTEQDYTQESINPEDAYLAAIDNGLALEFN